jgi:hypothetical protein
MRNPCVFVFLLPSSSHLSLSLTLPLLLPHTLPFLVLQVSVRTCPVVDTVGRSGLAYSSAENAKLAALISFCLFASSST